MLKYTLLYDKTIGYALWGYRVNASDTHPSCWYDRYTEGIKMMSGDQTVFTGKPLSGLIQIMFKISKFEQQINANNYKLWHKRLGHGNKNILRK